MFRIATLAALTLVATPVFAADAQSMATTSIPIHRGQVLRDAAGTRLGAIDSVANDGSIGLIVDGQYVRLAASAVTNVDGKAQTSLSKKEVKLMR